MNFLKRFFGHLRTVNRHRRLVRKLCFKCGLYWQGLTHDLSKYSPVEFWNGVRYYTGKQSPHVGEREATGYSKAWIHHHNRNKHHAEYWWDINRKGEAYPMPMPTKYLLEMVCDRVAASMIYRGEAYTKEDPLAYYLSHTDENKFNWSTRNELTNYLNEIATYGFDYFAENRKFSLRNQEKKK